MEGLTGGLADGLAEGVEDGLAVEAGFFGEVSAAASAPQAASEPTGTDNKKARDRVCTRAPERTTSQPSNRGTAGSLDYAIARAIRHRMMRRTMARPCPLGC